MIFTYSYWKAGDRKQSLLTILFIIFLMTSTIIAFPLNSMSIDNHNISEKSTVPNSNDSLINTTLLVIVDGIQLQELYTLQTETENSLNITVFFRDNTSNPLHGATVELQGLGNMTETLNQYNYTLNTNEVGLGINILTIFAQLEGYQPQTFQFFIEVVEKATRIQLFLNSIDKTNDTFLEIPIRSLINITVKFYDNRTGFEIPNALVQLFWDSLFENLTENSIFNQYSLILNSSQLSIGVTTFIIVAQAPYYEMKTFFLRIKVNRIKANISGNSLITGIVGEMIHIEVELTDLDFGGTITDATVTYRWQFGQGLLTDLESDGIYETFVVINMTGGFILIVTAFGVDIYDFETFEIVIIVTQHPFELPTIPP